METMFDLLFYAISALVIVVGIVEIRRTNREIRQIRTEAADAEFRFMLHRT